MIILGNLWDNWVSKESLKGAAKRVGISAEGLGIHFMQKEKFEQAGTIMEVDEEPQLSSRADVVASPKDIRKGSAQYWQRKYEMAQAIIREASEKSLKLEEIPGRPFTSCKGEAKKECGEHESDANLWFNGGERCLADCGGFKEEKGGQSSSERRKEQKKEGTKRALL